MNPPDFWRHGGNPLWPALLSGFEPLTAWLTARRVRRAGFRASVPVICCGNATVGGAGKTTLALHILAHYAARGVAVAAITRGYGGSVRGVHQAVAGRDVPALTGDEALLLARLAPTYVSVNRAAAAREAIAAGAKLLVMDDGLQNPTLEKAFSFLVIDGQSGFGNGHLLPAGPLREPVAAAATRCGAAVLIGEDRTRAISRLPPHLTLLRASLVPDPALADLSGQKLFAFAGIGRPEKFFTMLRDAGQTLAGTRGFADHHQFTAAELDQLQRDAAKAGAQLVTTPKDQVRLPPDFPACAIGVSLDFHDPSRLAGLLDSLAP